MYLLNQASLAVRSHLEAALRDLQMTGIQYTILSTIKEHEGISSAELSRRFFVTAQTTNEIINGLEQRGLISRKEDPANKRILRMKLTGARTQTAQAMRRNRRPHRGCGFRLDRPSRLRSLARQPAHAVARLA